MKYLDGRDVAGFIKQRHAQQVRSFPDGLKLAIVRQGATPATDMYLKVKQRYGEDIGVTVETYTETAADVVARIKMLNRDKDLTGLIVELPFADDSSLTDAALAAVALDKDVDGLAPKTGFEVATPKAILWLLAAYNVDLKGRRIAVVGQGRLVGQPLADRLEASGHEVVRYDITTTDLAKKLLEAEIIISATGQAGLITPAMIADGAVVVDAGSPSDLAPEVFDRADITVTPNPGGVGPMTVAALFDNVLIAAQQSRK